MIHLFVSPKNLFQAFFYPQIGSFTFNQPGDVKFQVPSWKRIHENLTR